MRGNLRRQVVLTRDPAHTCGTTDRLDPLSARYIDAEPPEHNPQSACTWLPIRPVQADVIAVTGHGVTITLCKLLAQPAALIAASLSAQARHCSSIVFSAHFFCAQQWVRSI